jgi:hypothetical protein
MDKESLKSGEFYSASHLFTPAYFLKLYKYGALLALPE